MPDRDRILVCFAVKEEAAPFRAFAATRPDIHVLVTGMGAENARRSFLGACEQCRPQVVITCGYAGGLSPDLPAESVLLDADAAFPLKQAFLNAGARQGTFHCAKDVAITAREKAALHGETRCDAVEMESGIIRQICAQRGIPSATVRIISDAADEDLPLNFNKLMTPQMTMDFGKLAWALVKSPGRIPALMRFGKRVKSAAEKLGSVLAATLTR